MDLQPRLIAGADMCETGEDVNLDELAFLLRYSAEELSVLPELKSNCDRLVESLRQRILARCDLLDKGEKTIRKVKEADLADLEILDEEIDLEIRNQYQIPQNTSFQGVTKDSDLEMRNYQCGR